MGKVAKGSRKGKKAWRANIRTDDIDAFFEKETRDALAGAAAIPSLPSHDLFFLDNPAKDAPVKRKIEKSREKVLHHESVLRRNPYVRPVPSSTTKSKAAKTKANNAMPEIREDKSVPMEEDDWAEKNLDIWGGNGEGNANVNKRSAPSIIPAVEVDAPGCSFNPPEEYHQDSLAQAVADEMDKIYKKELGPKPVPLTVPGEAIAEDDKFFLDADGGDEDVEEDHGDEDTDGLAGPRKTKTKRITRVELNKRARHKERLKAEAEAKKIENLTKEIDSLPDLMNEIAKEDEEKEKRRIRRAVAKQERVKSGPPRLGRHKFEPAPVQVLLKEEISGSLRKLKGCCTLARDRYKSLEKRGLLAPRAKKIRKRR